MRWASWVNFILGLWLIVASFALGFSHVPGAAAEDVILGVLIAVFALWAASTVAASGPSWVEFALGVWVVIAPFVLGYSAASAVEVTNDVIVGAVVLLLALVRVVGARRPVRTTAA
jgi:hypothetical protein